MDIQRLDLDLHRLELRFAGTRLVDPRAVERLARSIEAYGQIEPCVAVGDGDALCWSTVTGGLRRCGGLAGTPRASKAGPERWPTP